MSITVMVTGVGGGGVGEQIVKALRLARTSYRIIGTDITPISKGLMSVDQPYVVPSATDPAFLPFLTSICERHNVQALFCGSEVELRMVSKQRDQFEKIGVFLPINPQEVLDICLDKFATASFLSQHGFHAPKSQMISNVAELEQVCFMPTILKPLSGGGSADVYIAQSKDELRQLGHYLLRYYPCIVAQEYVGRADAEYTVGVLLSMDGKLINSVAIRRNIMSGLGNRLRLPNRTGNSHFGDSLVISSGISQGHLDRYPEVTKTCEDIAVALGCRGAVNIQCRLVDGRPYVFEINPRFSGTTSLRALAGYNEPDVLVRQHILQEIIPPYFSYSSSYIMRGLVETLVDTDHIPATLE